MDETAYDSVGGQKVQHTILPPPRTDQEREERRALAAYIVAMDCCFSAVGRWPGTLHLDQVVRLLLPLSGKIMSGGADDSLSLCLPPSRTFCATMAPYQTIPNNSTLPISTQSTFLSKRHDMEVELIEDTRSKIAS